MSNQIIYSAVYLPNIRFRYGLQNRIRNLLKTKLRIFLLPQICPKRVNHVSTLFI